MDLRTLRMQTLSSLLLSLPLSPQKYQFSRSVTPLIAAQQLTERYPLSPSAVTMTRQRVNLAIGRSVRLAVLSYRRQSCSRLGGHVLWSLKRRVQPDSRVIVCRRWRCVRSQGFAGAALRIVVGRLRFDHVDATAFVETHRSADFAAPPQRLRLPLPLQPHVVVAHLRVAGVLAQRVRLPEAPAAGVAADAELAEMQSLEVVLVVHALGEQSIAQLTQHRSGRCINHRNNDKKSELMLTRRATASVQFRTQVVLVYLQYISAKIHSKCAPQPKIAKNHLKPTPAAA